MLCWHACLLSPFISETSPLRGPGRGPPCCGTASHEHRGSLSRPPGCSVALGPSCQCVHRPAKETPEQKGERVLRDAFRCRTGSEVALGHPARSAPVSHHGNHPEGRPGGVVQALSCVRLFATCWTAARQAPLSTGFSRQEYWSGPPFPPPGDLPDSGWEPCLPHWQASSLPLRHQGSPMASRYLQSKHFLWHYGTSGVGLFRRNETITTANTYERLSGDTICSRSHSKHIPESGFEPSGLTP